MYICCVSDPMKEGVKISEGMIGGIVGGLLFLLVAIILAVIAVKIFNKRKQREKAMRYGQYDVIFSTKEIIPGSVQDIFSLSL